MNVPLIDLVAQYRSLEAEIQAAIRGVLESGKFILGPEVTALENEVGDYLGKPSAVGVASGTDALILSLKALGVGPGDEVIVPAFTFFATVGAVMQVGATPVFVDIEPESFCIDVAQIQDNLTDRTRAIIPVHLFGYPADLDPIFSIASKGGVEVVEDAAQALGATYGGRRVGGVARVGCLSFFPTKNLGGYGDGGMVIADEEIADRVRLLRTHGWKVKYDPETLGYNSRLDELQAAILRVKLPHLEEWNQRRSSLAKMYCDALEGMGGVVVPYEPSTGTHVYHLFIVRVEERETVRKKLAAEGIATAVYYQKPLHLSNPCQHLGYERGTLPEAERASDDTLALPLYPELGEQGIEAVVDALGRAMDG